MQREIKPLTSLRFAAALLVFASHGTLTFGWAHRYELGEIGVGFFFVLSGFILTVTYARDFRESPGGPALRRFFLARFARIYPVLFATTLLAVAVLATAGGNAAAFFAPSWPGLALPGRAAATLSTLLLAQAWLPIPALLFGANAPAWSLSAEAFFYACFPFLACLALRCSARAGARPLVAAACLGWAALAAWAALASPPWYLLYSWPPVRTVDFAVGVMLGAAFVFRPARAPARATVAEAVSIAFAVGAIAALPWVPPSLRHAAWMMPAWGLMIWTFAHQSGAISRILAAPAALFLGRISYAFYLVHVSVLLAFAAHLRLPQPVSDALALVLAIALSAALYRWVEEPMRRRIAGRQRGAMKTGRTMSSWPAPAS